MTQWANVLAAGGAAAAGGLITGASAIWAQVLTHRSTSERERESQRESFQIERFEIEQETLLALQDALAEVSTLFASIRAGFMDSGQEAALAANEKISHVMKLANRALATDAAHAAIEYGTLVSTALLAAAVPRPSDEAVQEAWVRAMVLTGHALRRDPFTGSDPRADPPGRDKA